MPPKDPNLTEARDEILAILKRRDIGGLVIVTSEKDRVEYLLHLEASWSCAHTEETPFGRALRVRCKLSEYKDKAEASRFLAATVGAILGILDTMGDLKDGMQQIIGMIGKEVDVQHWTRRDPET